jgi:C4-dicarboxylate-specific signal transduction histidine kinase
MARKWPQNVMSRKTSLFGRSDQSDANFQGIKGASPVSNHRLIRLMDGLLPLAFITSVCVALANGREASSLPLVLLGLVILWQNRRYRRKYERLLQTERAEVVEITQAERIQKGNLVDALDFQMEMNFQNHEFNLSGARMNAVAAMAAGISHEINNPLTILNGNMFLLKDKYLRRQGEDPAELELLNKSLHASNRISRVVKELFDFTRTSNRRDIESCLLMDVWNGALMFSRERIATAGIELVVGHWPSGLMVMARYCDLVQVVNSVLANSVEAISGMDRPRIEVSVYETESRIILRIQDSGRGIPEEIVKHIFVPFFTTKDPGSNIGIGLSVVKTHLSSFGSTISYLPGMPNTTFEIDLLRGVIDGDEASKHAES